MQRTCSDVGASFGRRINRRSRMPSCMGRMLQNMGDAPSILFLEEAFTTHVCVSSMMQPVAQVVSPRGTPSMAQACNAPDPFHPSKCPLSEMCHHTGLLHVGNYYYTYPYGHHVTLPCTQYSDLKATTPSNGVSCILTTTGAQSRPPCLPWSSMSVQSTT